ncbi:MAG: Eco57I restriction-modification methylase domain-containing protein [Opitutaceae bacterium]
MPALVLLRYGDSVSLAILHRRLNKRDASRDVLEKATLIKDIAFADPIRAHVEILNDFALANLAADFGVANFVALHEAWQKRLGSYALSNAFYREIADWYFWAHHQVGDGTIRLPLHCDTEQEKSLFLIRLLTRVVFCWFLVEKRLIPTELFRAHRLQALLKDFHPSRDPKKPDTAPAYYRAVLQNLFFGTLNMPPDQRAFREKKKEGQRYDQNFGITNLWRYETAFRTPADWLGLAARVPFLNGGLFDCLDDKSGKRKDNFILDGFSDREDHGCHLPNDLFFGPERIVDLSPDYGEEDKRTARSKKAKVRGLIEILSRYKFTIEENTPLEEEIALDPELLGKVFENLLASYNEDTRTTARKALGAFYTPREIVGYMVDEALKSYLSTQVPRCKGALEDLFSKKATLKEIKPDTREALIAAIGRVKILDPACGSGAFPMGALHRLVDLLQKLDPNNEKWREIQRRRAIAETEEAFKSGDRESREVRLKEINDTFEFNSSDYGRKLYLIENSIYGVDIQPIATQIAKLRFFISLVVDQKVDAQAPNLGVRPLPNLETRLVAADTLIPIEKAESDLFSGEIDQLRAELAAIRHKHFNARSPAAKRKWRDADAAKRGEIAEKLEDSHALSKETARKLAAWDPYDQNAFAPFFDSEWMFGLPVGKVRLDVKAPATLLGNLALVNEAGGQTELTPNAPREIDSGFDVVIGNPPYVRQEKIKHLKPLLQPNYQETYSGTADLYVYFYGRALKLLRPSGIISYITSNSFLNSAFGEKLRMHLAKTTSIHVLIDFAEARVFTAITEPCIFIAKKEPSESNTFKALRWDEEKRPDNVREEFTAHAFAIPQGVLGSNPWQIEVPRVRELLDRLVRGGTPLGEFVKGRFYYGLKTGLNEAFIVEQPKRDEIARDKKSARYLKPFLRGKDLRPWKPEFDGQWLIVIPSSENVSHPWSGQRPAEAEKTFRRELPAIYDHFLPLRDKLIARGDKGHYYWELRSCAYYEEFSKPKVIYQEINRTDSYAYDDSGLYMNNKLFMLPEAPIWLVAILNSPVATFYLHRSTGVPKGGFLALQWPVFSPTPIPQTAAAQERFLVWFVRLRITLTSISADVQTTRDPLMLAYWEQILNGLVYELYFPEELHAAGLRFFDLVAQAQLPDISTIPEPDRLKILRASFEELYDGAHPLRRALDHLQTLDVVRIIEGKAPLAAKPATARAAAAVEWRLTRLKHPLHTRQVLGDRYQPAMVVELLAQAGLPVSFEVFRRAYWFLTQPDRLAAWIQGTLPQFGAKEWRTGFTENLPAQTFFAHLKAMVQQGQIKLRTLDGEVCVVDTKAQPAGIAHVVCDARLALLAAESHQAPGVVPALSVTEKNELAGLASPP